MPAAQVCLPRPHMERLLDDLVVVGSDLWNPGLPQRRSDGLLHDVNSTGPACACSVETDEWN